MAIEVTQNLTQVTISSVGVQGPKGEKGDSAEIQDVSVLATTSSFNSFTASYLSDSASFDSRISAATNEQDLSGYLSASIFNNLSGSFNSFTSSYLTDSASFASRIESATNEQDLSYLATTGSNEFDGDQTITGFVSASNGVYVNVINPLIGSDTINLTATNLSGDNLTVNSLIVTGSVSGDAFQRIATTGSNTFVGNQTISGSIRLEGDTIDNGINFGTGNTYVGTAEGFLYIKDEGGYIQIDAQNPTNYAQIILAADNEDFFYVNHDTTNNTLKFTTNGNLLLNEIPYDAHLATTSSLLTLATTGSNSFIGDQNVLGTLYLLDNSNTSSIALSGGDLEITAPDNTGVSINTYNTSTDTLYTWYFDSSGELQIAGNVNGVPNLATTGSNTFVGTQIVSGSILFEDGSYIDNGWMHDYNTSGSLAWSNRQLYDENENTSINWGDRRLYNDSGNSTVLRWGGANPEFFGTSSWAVSASWAPSSEVTLPDGLISSSQQIENYNIFATTGSNTFVGDQTISGSVNISGSINLSTVAGELIISSSGNILLVGDRNITTTFGDITLQPFDDLRLYGGASTDENTEGGDVVIRGGDGPDEVGGTISTAGDITIRGGHGGSGSIDSGGWGGDVTIFGGDSLTEAVGGAVRIYGGFGYNNFGSVFIGNFGPNEVEFNENTGELLGPLWTIDRGTIYLDTSTQDQKIFFGATNTSSFIGTNFGPLEIYDSSGDFKINSTNVTIEGQLNVTSSLVVTGSVEVVGSITASVVSSSYMKFDSLPNGTAPTYQEGLLYYDNDMGALTFYNDETDISLQIGQESYVRAINVSGDDILNGTPVRVSGSQGDRVKIYKAEAFIHTGSYNDSEAHNHILGIATHDILDTETGYVTISGLVKGINTDIYEAGDILYVQTGSAGVLTNVAPPFPYDKIQVGVVGRKHASVGEVLVLPKEPTHFGNITGLSGSLTTEVGDLWVYKSNNAWATSKTLEGDYTITGSLTIEGSGSLNGDNIVSSNTIQKIETISSASYAALNPPVSGTLYIII